MDKILPFGIKFLLNCNTLPFGNFLGVFREGRNAPFPCEKRSAEHDGSLRAGPQQDELGVSQLPSCHEEPATRGRWEVITEGYDVIKNFVQSLEQTPPWNSAENTGLKMQGNEVTF